MIKAFVFITFFSDGSRVFRVFRIGSGCSSTTDPSNLVKINEAIMHTSIVLSNVHNAHKQHMITDLFMNSMNCTPFIYVNLLMLIVLWICALFKYVCTTFWGIYIFSLKILDYITITLHV